MDHKVKRGLNFQVRPLAPSDCHKIATDQKEEVD